MADDQQKRVRDDGFSLIVPAVHDDIGIPIPAVHDEIGVPVMADEPHDNDTPPMTDERMAEIRERFRRMASPFQIATVYDAEAGFDLLAAYDRLRADVAYWQHETARSNEHRATVIAERDRLRAREAAAMAIVQAVADDPGVYIFEEDDGYYAPCQWCHARSAEQHTPDCPVTKARALLAQE